jgi:hypothetical protein
VSIVLISVAAFAASVTIDFLYVAWFHYSKQDSAHKAALCTVGIGLAGIAGTYVVIEYSEWYLIPDLLGLYVGTFLGIKAKKIFEKKDENN